MTRKPGRPFGTTKGRKKVCLSISLANSDWIALRKALGDKMSRIVDAALDKERENG